MKTSSHRTVGLGILLAAIGLIVFWWGRPSTERNRQEPASNQQAAKDIRETVSPDGPVADAFSKFDERSKPLETLKELQAMLAAMPRDEAIKWIASFLTKGRDKSTGLSFVLGNDQAMTEWPTFRTFLIDALLAIDPAAAAEISRKILDSPTSADEWALALRNIGKAEPPSESSEYLRVKTEELIANPAWQAEPSIGFLNAFDVLVHTQATASTPLLSSLIQRKDRKDLAHAGFLTLDRLVQRQPTDVLARLATDSALTESRPEMVAQQFARADLRDPTQRDTVKNWLLDPARTATELRSFVGVYPNNNRFISNNLLTRETTQSGEDLAAHDREVLEIITAWEADPAFANVKPHLLGIQQRLLSFASQPEQPSESTR